MRLADLPVARKLALLVAANTLVALVLITLVFATGAAIKAYHDTEEQLNTLAGVIGENSRAALAFGDESAATATLAALQAEPRIAAARLVTPQGTVLARYLPPKAQLPQVHDAAILFLPLPTRISLAHTVLDQGQPAGYLEIDADITHVWLDLLHGLAIAMSIALLLTGVALFFGLRLSEWLIAPIRDLTRTTRRISRDKDYRVRANKTSNDEIGALVDDFNHMLEEISARDMALQAEQQSLEVRVVERTAQLRQAKDEAEQANAAKSEFLSRMSHELRTPLNAVIGFGQLLEIADDPPLSPQQADNVREILKAGRYLLEQVNEVLDLARIESGRIELRTGPVPLAALANECISHLHPLTQQHHVSINLTIAPDQVVLADASRLKQVMINLLSNAIKYNRQGGRVAITAYPSADNFRVVVEDTGRGIAPASIQRLFHPFERLESSYEGIEGTGIGLALVKHLIEAMGGEIGVDSTPGMGSRFWFDLPASKLPMPQLLAPEKVGAGETAPKAGTGKRQIVLYVEDNMPNLKLVRKIFAAWPEVALVDAPNAESGLTLAQREVPDLILLDINLPGMDGFAALRELRADPTLARVPVIAVTANAMLRDADKCHAAGFDGYLAKPFDIPTFRKTIARHLNGAQGLAS
jgi:signal transduction histidine kinase/CheY-like chemotaxis protein